MEKLKGRVSVFKGKIGSGYTGSYTVVTLEDESGWNLNLNSRIGEVAMNNPNCLFAMSIFISDEKRTYEELKEKWLYELVGGHMESEMKSYDCQYSSYTRWTEYETSLTLGGHDIQKILLQNPGKWAYIKIEPK